MASTFLVFFLTVVVYGFHGLQRTEQPPGGAGGGSKPRTRETKSYYSETHPAPAQGAVGRAIPVDHAGADQPEVHQSHDEHTESPCF